MEFNKKIFTVTLISTLFFLLIFIALLYIILVSQYKDIYSKFTISQTPCDTATVTIGITEPDIGAFIKPKEVTLKIYYKNGRELFLQETLNEWESVKFHSPKITEEYRVVVKVKAPWEITYQTEDQDFEFNGTENCKKDLEDLLKFL